MDVSEATTADIEGIATFFHDAWAEAGPDADGWTGASEDVIAEITHPDAIAARIGGPERRMFLARDGERVVGFAATRRIDDRTLELAGIVVLDSMTGHGIGPDLLVATIAEAEPSEYETLVVRTESDNDRALHFYESHGFDRASMGIERVEGTDVELVQLHRSVGSGGSR